MTTPDPVALVERLLKVESGNADFVTGLCTNWHRNPDGPEAAAAIEAQAARIAELEGGLKPFATRCDEAVRPDDADMSSVTAKVIHLRQARSLLSERVRGDCAEDGSVPSVSDDRPVTQ